MAFGPGRKVQKGPGKGVILSKSRALKASKAGGGGKLKNGWQLQFKVKRDLAYDLDMRKIIEHVSLRLAEYFRRQLKAGHRASGRGSIEPTSEKTRQQYGGGGTLGVRSGYMADHWQLLKITGGSIKAARILKPYGGTGGATPDGAGPGGRAFVIQNLLKRRKPVDFQSVRGEAAKVIQKAFDEAVSRGFGDVNTPARANTRAGLLPELRK